MKKLLLSSIVALLSLSCTVTQPLINTSQDFTDLEKEYNSFSTKALSNAYVSRMFNKFLTASPNPTQVIRQLEFARYLKGKSDTSYFDSLKSIIANDTSIYTKIIGSSGVSQKMTSESGTFGVFVQSISPLPGVPVATTATAITATSFTANWNSVANATGYKLYIDGILAYTGTALTFDKTGLLSGSSHTYYVQATNSGGTSSDSNTVNVTTFAVPAGFVSVQGGTFTMGSAEFPIAHQVTLSNFFIGKYEITQAEWASVYATAPTNYNGLNYKTLMGSNSDPSYFPVTGNNGNLPVERVSSWDAIAYCNAKSISEGRPVAYNPVTGDLLNESGNVTTDTTLVKGYRLPTEAEWEFASKGGNSSLGYTYSGSNTATDVGWYQINSGNTTHDVGTKAANELGIYDMSGNLFEWCQDYYVSQYSSNPETNPYISSVFSMRIIRGGYWDYGIDGSRSVKRANYQSDNRTSFIGFRVVRSAN